MVTGIQNHYRDVKRQAISRIYWALRLPRDRPKSDANPITWLD